MEDRVDMAIEDRHNVHNSCLKRTASIVIQKLMLSDRHIYTVDSALHEIFDMLELCPDTDIYRLENATQALTLMCSMDAIYQSCDIAEKELLRLLWDRINHPVNVEVKDQLKDNFIDQLADCRNGYSGVHCCEGRVMRLLQAFENCDKEAIVELRPMWAYKEEISNKIYLYRQKLLGKVSKMYQDIENKLELTQRDRDLLDKFNKCLIRNLGRRFEIDYVSKGLLTRYELDDITQTYYESLYDF
jgi:hypothetical protein